MAGWTEAGPNRWVYLQDDSDGSRNYMQRRGSELTEMHVSGNAATLHRYVIPEGATVEDDNPLLSSGARWIRSTELTLPAAPSGEQAWALLDETDR